MSFRTTARAVLVGLKYLRGMAFATALVLLAALLISCGSGKLPAFQATQNAYVTLPTADSVLLLHINGLTGEITPEAQTPQVSGTAPKGLALLGKKFVYVANSGTNTISIFTVASDGTLNLTGTPTPDGGTGPFAAAIDPSGKYLLVTNTFSNNISVFSIDSSSGALTPVSGSPFYANFSPAELLMVPSGNLVYVTNGPIGTVTAFTFDPSSGFLTQVSGSPFESGAGASGMAVSSNGLFLYVANTAATNPGSAATGNISGFTINSTTGQLVPIANSPFRSTVGSGPSAMVVDPNGQFVFATTAGNSYSVWCFSSQADGELQPEPSSPYSVAAGSLFAVIDTTGLYFYIGSETAKGVEAYTYNQGNGAPAIITNSPFLTGNPPSAPGKMVIVQ